MTFLRSFVATLALLLLATPAAAQQFNPQSDVPTIIDSDTADYRPGYILLKGQVDVRQGDVRVLADQMKIFTEGATPGSAATDGITRIEADGNFYYITPEQEVKGTRGVYLASNDTVTVTGDVILLQEDNVVTGNELVYDLNTEEARVVGTCEGRQCGRQGRVRILLKQTRDPVRAPAPAATGPSQ